MLKQERDLALKETFAFKTFDDSDEQKVILYAHCKVFLVLLRISVKQVNFFRTKKYIFLVSYYKKSHQVENEMKYLNTDFTKKIIWL